MKMAQNNHIYIYRIEWNTCPPLDTRKCMRQLKENIENIYGINIPFANYLYATQY
jgi:hypothetical protein